MAPPEAALRLLGLAARAGSVLPGTERAREAIRAGNARLVLVAGDISGNTHEKLVPLLQARGIPYVVGFDRERLGAAVGRAPLSAVAVTDRLLAARLAELLGGGMGTQ